MTKEKLEQIIAIFKKYGGKAEQSALTRGTKYEDSLEIREQPKGLTNGFDGLVRITEGYTKDSQQVFYISSTATWLTLDRAEEYQKQLAIALAVIKEIYAVDPKLAGARACTSYGKSGEGKQ